MSSSIPSIHPLAGSQGGGTAAGRAEHIARGGASPAPIVLGLYLTLRLVAIKKKRRRPTCHASSMLGQLAKTILKPLRVLTGADEHPPDSVAVAGAPCASTSRSRAAGLTMDEPPLKRPWVDEWRHLLPL